MVLQEDVMSGNAGAATQQRLEMLEEGQRLCAVLGPLKCQIADASRQDLRDSMYDERYARSTGEQGI